MMFSQRALPTRSRPFCRRAASYTCQAVDNGLTSHPERSARLRGVRRPVRGQVQRGLSAGAPLEGSPASASKATSRKEALRYATVVCSAGLLPTPSHPTNPSKRRAIRNDPPARRDTLAYVHEPRQYPSRPCAQYRSASATYGGHPNAPSQPLDGASRRRRATQIRPLRDPRHGATPSFSNTEEQVLKNNKFDALTARLAGKALRFWEAHEALNLIITAGLSASVVAMIWLPWITGKPTMTVLELPVLVPAVRALLRQRRRPAL
jgi:hypothetical protein